MSLQVNGWCEPDWAKKEKIYPGQMIYIMSSLILTWDFVLTVLSGGSIQNITEYLSSNHHTSFCRFYRLCIVLTFPVESLRRGSNRIQVWKPDKQFVYTEYFLKYRLLPNEVLNQLLLRTHIIKIKARSRLHCRNIFFKH